MSNELTDHYIKNLDWGLVELTEKKPTGNVNWPNEPVTNTAKLSAGNVGLNHGYSKTCTLDIDHVAAEIALKIAGIDLLEILREAPYKIVGDPDNPPKPVFKMPEGFVLATRQLRWPDPEGRTNKNGSPKLVTIFELRGGQGFQDVLPPSIHPDTKQPYKWQGGPPQSPGDIPMIPQKLLGLWLTWDDQAERLKNACPWVESPTPPTPTTQPIGNGNNQPDFDVSMIQTEFNKRYRPVDILEKNGYTPKGKKWLCPDSDSGNPGVIPLGDGEKILSYHGSDPLSDGHPHDAYDCYVILDHGGNHKAAWHAAKNELNVDIGHHAATIARANEAERTANDDTPAAPDLLPYIAADTGNADAFMLLYGGDYLYTTELGWLRYTGKYWDAKGGDEIIKRDIINTLIERRTQAVKADTEPIVKSAKPSANNIRNCKYILQSWLLASIDEFDSDPDLLNCDNGMVNLKSGELVTHKQEQRFTYCTDTAYDPHADDSQWSDWIYNTVTPAGSDDNGQYADLAAWLQMAIGYSLTGHTHEQCLFFLQGPPRAGKGVLFQILNRLLGRPLSSGVDFDTFTQKRNADNQNFDLAGLKPCRLVSASESERATMLNAKRVKAITGNDSVYCAHKGKPFFTYTPQYKIWLSSNFRVKAAADDDALWSRLRVIHFPNSHLGKEDFNLEERLWKHKTGILKWAIDGAIAWHKRKAVNVGLGRPEIITNAVRSHREENDTVKQFIDDACTVAADSFALGAQLTSAYRDWCNENGLPALGGRRLGESLRLKGFDYKAKLVLSKTKKCWIGIGLDI